MSDISIDIPWWVIALMSPVLWPVATALGAILCGFFGYRAQRRVAHGVLAAVAGALVFPWVTMLVWIGVDAGLPRIVVAAIALGALGLLGGALWKINRAGSRSRQSQKPKV